jgi:hypothetical protein
MQATQVVLDSLNSQIAEANEQLNAALIGNGGDVPKIRRNIANLRVALSGVQGLIGESYPNKQVSAEAAIDRDAVANVRKHLEARARKAEADFVEALKSFVAYVRVCDMSPAGQYGSVLSIFRLGDDLEWLDRTGALRA